jgi:membrane-bound lytic murein transglycosylase D
MYGVAVNELKYMNKIRGKYVAPGKQIVVGYYPIEKTPIKKLDSLIPPKVVLILEDSNKVAISKMDTTTATKKPFKGFVYYKVLPGDTIWSIARKFPGITHLDIINNNKLKEGHIQPGQVLKIPKG